MTEQEVQARIAIERARKIAAEQKRQRWGGCDEREPHSLDTSVYHGIRAGVPRQMDAVLAGEAKWAELEAEANRPPLDSNAIWQASESGVEHVRWNGRGYSYWVDGDGG